jgi:hypothetical protein
MGYSMTVLAITKRLEDTDESFYETWQVPESRLFLREAGTCDGPATLILTVGRNFINHRNGNTYAIGKGGLSLRPRRSVTIEAAEEMLVPLNWFGYVTGKGQWIRKGVVTAPGKIDPGFRGYLRVTMHNGSRHKRRLAVGDPLALAAFHVGEFTLSARLEQYEGYGSPDVQPPPMRVRLADWLTENWRSAAAAFGGVCVTVAAVLEILNLIGVHLHKA